MKKKIIQLETNYLYYLSGVSRNPRIDITKVKSTLENFTVVISPWTFVELITTQDFTNEQKKIIVKYIINNQIGVQTFIENGKYYDFSRLINDYCYFLFSEPNKLNTFLKRVMKLKKDEEVKILNFYITFIISFIYYLFYNKLEKLNINKNKKKCFTFCVFYLLKANTPSINRRIKKIINSHYVDFEENKTKKSLTELIGEYGYLISVIYDKVIEGSIHKFYPGVFEGIYAFNDLTVNDGASSTSKQLIRLLNKFTSAKKINLRKIFLDEEIEIVKKKIIAEFEKYFPIGTLNYILIHIEKVIKENKSLNKNDSLDSYMLNHYSDSILLTDDEGSIKIIKEFDEELYGFLISLRMNNRP